MRGQVPKTGTLSSFTGSSSVGFNGILRRRRIMAQDGGHAVLTKAEAEPENPVR